jgi:hypothetical protein
MRGRNWFALSVLTAALVASAPAVGQPSAPAANAAQAAAPPKNPLLATIRIVESTPIEARAIVDRVDVERRLAWRGGADEAVYQGTPESLVRLKLRADGAQAGAELVGALVRASEEDLQLGRPPMIAIAIPPAMFRGVVESLTSRCDAKQCEADVVLLQTQRASARAPGTEDAARSPGF